MSQGAAYPTLTPHIKWYYKSSADALVMPGDLSAAAALLVGADAAVQFMYTTNDVTLPAENAAGGAAPLISRRYHGADRVTTFTDIAPAPDAGAQTFDIVFDYDLRDETHKAIIEAQAKTYAYVIGDLQTLAGDGVRGVGVGNAEGSLIVTVVSHFDAPVTAPASATTGQATVTFQYDAVGRKRQIFDYGQP